ncbi:MAG: L,D-transpeptidase [Coriobacteriales bacterium]|nr:L,D-transpeptidase [Coriobacteriales bacterium]
MHDIAEGGDEITHSVGSSEGRDDNMDSTGKLPRLDLSDLPEVASTQDELQTDEDFDEDFEPLEQDFIDDEGAFEAPEAVSSEEFMNWGFEDSPVWEDSQEDSYVADGQGTDANLFGGYAVQVDTNGAYGDEQWEEERQSVFSNPRKRTGIIVVLVVLALLACYGAGVFYFSSHFLFNSTINGLNVSGASLDAAQAALEQETDGYSCSVRAGGFSTVVPGHAIAVDRDEQALVQQAFAKQSPLVWPISILTRSHRVVEQTTSYDEAALAAMLDQAVDAYHQETLPEDNAYIEYNYDTGVYELAGETSGSAIDKNVLNLAVNASVSAFSTECTPDESTVTRPATVADIPSYGRVAEWINRDRSSDIHITVDGETVATADADLISEWVSVGTGPSVEVDKDAIELWADYSVADAAFSRDDWDNHYLDVDLFVDDLAARLATGVVEDFEAPRYEKRRLEGTSRDQAYAYSGWDSERGRYIDVDLTAQFARLFSETGEVLWESAVVSGNTYESHSTVTGDYEIYAKQTNTVLVGMDYNGDGSPDYESFVNYWMPFYGGYGLHDATWRYTFGGELYAYDGSHGCVNLPYEKAEELYGLTFVGEKVHIYWEESSSDSDE